jgi:RNA polymerase sigma factor (sigma-70 family)
MKIDNAVIMEALTKNDRDTIVKLCDTIIYFHLHRSGLWARYPSYRDDFLQEGRMGILTAIDNWRGGGKAQFTTFAHIVVRNHLFSYARKMKWLNGEASDYELNDEDVSGDYDMKPLTLADTIFGEIKNDKYANVLNLYFIQEYTQDTIGKMIGKSQQWVNSVCNDFKQKMIEKYGKIMQSGNNINRGTL